MKKANLKNVTDVDTSHFDNKSYLASLKSEIYALDTGKFETTPVDLSKLSDVFKTEIFKKTVYDELAKKSNAIQTSNLVERAD